MEGNSLKGYDDGEDPVSQFNSPCGVAENGAGNVFMVRHERRVTLTLVNWMRLLDVLDV
jgi:hypothetical protein